MRYLFVHQNFPGQFRHVASALAARGHEVVAMGVNRTQGELPGVRHLLYTVPAAPRMSGGKHTLAGAMAELHAKVIRGEAAAQAMMGFRARGIRARRYRCAFRVGRSDVGQVSFSEGAARRLR
jgi:hypothetical protein